MTFILAVILIALTIFGGRYVFIPFLAKRDILFSDDVEGYGKVIMMGGKAVKFVGGLPNGEYYDKYGVLTPGYKRPFLSERLGIIFIGIPPLFSLYSYKFIWFKWGIEEGSEKYGLVKREEVINKTKIRSTYALSISKAETKDRLPVNIVLQYDVIIRNLSLALFSTNGWLAKVNAAIAAAVRDFIALKDYNQLIVLQNEIHNAPGQSGSELVLAITSLNEDKVGNIPLMEQIGVFIESVNLVSLDIEEGEVQKATQKVYVAEQEAAAVMARISADAEKITAEATARAAGYKSEVEAVGGDPDNLAKIKLAEAIRENSGTLALGGNALLGLGEKAKSQVVLTGGKK